MKRRLAQLAVALSVGVTSCGADRITLPSNGGITLEASISDASIGPGETATVTYRVRNAGRIPRTLTLSCSLLSYIEDGNGAIVHPAGGGWSCAATRRTIRLVPGEEITRTEQVNSGEAFAHRGSTITLRPGRYNAYGEFLAGLPDVHGKLRLRSHNVTFEIGD